MPARPFDRPPISRGQTMDGDLKTVLSAEAEPSDAVAREAGGLSRPAAGRPRTALWLTIVGLLLVLALGGLYGFNRYREKAIANFFAQNKPPPAAVSAVAATSAAVPRFATGIGSLVAVNQVTVTPEVAGRVTAIMFKAG